MGIENISPSYLLDVYPTHSTITSDLLRVATTTGAGLYVTNNGNVGIGTTSPQTLLGLQGGIGVNSSQLYLAANGKLGVNASSLSTVGQETFDYTGATEDGLILNDTSASAGSEFMQFDSNSLSSGIGSIQNNDNTGVTYNTTSDIRLKENIATTTEGLATLMQIPVDDFNFISDPSETRVQGFIAQSLYPIYPEAVATSGTPATGLLGTSTPWQVDYGRITPLIVSAVQDIANISSSFEQNLIAWLGNAQNGIQNLYAGIGNFGQVKTQQLCVSNGPNDTSPVCITKSQLVALLGSASQPSGQGSGISQSNASASSSPDSSATPPVLQVNGDNPAIVQLGATYQDLGATITGPQQDLNLGISTFVNGAPMSLVQIDTSEAATDTIDYVATDQKGLTSSTTRAVIIEAPSIVPSDDASSSAATTTVATSTSS